MGREDADSEVAATGSPGTVSGVAGLGERRQAAGRGAERGCALGFGARSSKGQPPEARSSPKSSPAPRRGRVSASIRHCPGAPRVRADSNPVGRHHCCPCSRACAPGPCECPFLTAGGRCAWRPREASRGSASRAGFWTLWRTSRRSGRGPRGPTGRGARARPAEGAGGPRPLAGLLLFLAGGGPSAIDPQSHAT